MEHLSSSGLTLAFGRVYLWIGGHMEHESQWSENVGMHCATKTVYWGPFWACCCQKLAALQCGACEAGLLVVGLYALTLYSAHD